MMGPIAAVQSCLQKYFQFSGRATRPEYWWFFLVTVILVYGSGSIGLDGLSSLFWLATIIPWLAVSWRRLHDSDLAGPWILLPVIMLVVSIYGVLFSALLSIFPAVEETLIEAGIDENTTLGELAEMQIPDPDVAAGAFSNAYTSPFMILAIIAIVLALYLKLRASTPGSNRFGPQPGTSSTPPELPPTARQHYT